MRRELILNDRQIKGLITQDMLAKWWNKHSEQYKIRNTRERRNIIHKHSFFTIARNSTTLSLASIGAILGKDHATVLHAWRNHESNYKYDPSYRMIFDDMCVSIEDFLLDNGIVPKSMDSHTIDQNDVRDIHFKFLSVSRRLRDKIREIDSIHKSVELKVKRAEALTTHFSGMQSRIHQLENELKRVKNLL